MFVIVQSPQGLQNVQTNNSPLLNLNWKRLTTPHQTVFTQTWTQEQFHQQQQQGPGFTNWKLETGHTDTKKPKWQITQH